MPQNKNVKFNFTHIKPIERTKTELLCNECETTFKKILKPNTIEVKCPKCGSFDTEPI